MASSIVTNNYSDQNEVVGKIFAESPLTWMVGCSVASYLFYFYFSYTYQHSFRWCCLWLWFWRSFHRSICFLTGCCRCRWLWAFRWSKWKNLNHPLVKCSVDAPPATFALTLFIVSTSFLSISRIISEQKRAKLEYFLRSEAFQEAEICITRSLPLCCLSMFWMHFVISFWIEQKDENSTSSKLTAIKA